MAHNWRITATDPPCRKLSVLDSNYAIAALWLDQHAETVLAIAGRRESTRASTRSRYRGRGCCSPGADERERSRGVWHGRGRLSRPGFSLGGPFAWSGLGPDLRERSRGSRRGGAGAQRGHPRIPSRAVRPPHCSGRRGGRICADFRECRSSGASSRPRGGMAAVVARANRYLARHSGACAATRDRSGRLEHPHRP